MPNDLPIAVHYEHPDWFRPVFAELGRRGLPYVALDAAAHCFDPADPAPPYALVFNRASPSAYRRGHGQATFHTLQWLRYLDRVGVPVVNGAAAYELEISKAGQIELLERLRLPYPRARVINDPRVALEAARGLRYPIVVKANIGGSGAGIASFASEAELREAVQARRVELGIDGVALVQERAPLRDGRITRVETLGGRFLYAIHVYPDQDSFNLCPADVCQTADGRPLERTFCALDAPRTGMRVEAAEPPPEIVTQVERIAERARLDVGGIEYLVDDRDGRAYFYDINALSNFVADAPSVIGFDPFERLVDYLCQRAGFGVAEVA